MHALTFNRKKLCWLWWSGDNIQYLVQKNHSHPYQKQGLQDDENSYQKSESHWVKSEESEDCKHVFFWFFWLEGLGIYWRYRNRYRAFWVPEKSIGIGIVKIWYRKKVSVSVSSKFGTGKKYRYRYRRYLVPEKSIGIGIAQNYGYRHTLPSIMEDSGCCWIVFKGVFLIQVWLGRGAPHGDFLIINTSRCSVDLYSAVLSPVLKNFMFHVYIHGIQITTMSPAQHLTT